MKWYSIFFLAVVLFSQHGLAELSHTLLRRVAVFPIADANFANAEEAWWQMREVLTKDQRFFVASRRFMMNRGVFQPRRDLKPADAIILGKILDAQALVVTYLRDRNLILKVYEGENGYLLWEGSGQFHPALPINDQIVRMSMHLISSFVRDIPYQGFQIQDELIGQPTYEENGKVYAQIYVGSNSRHQKGDVVQWVEVTGDAGRPFFSSEGKVSVIAEGKISELKGDRVVVQVEKLRSLDELKENSLIRFPKEIIRLQDLYGETDKSVSLEPEYLSQEIKEVAELSQKHNPTSSALTWILSLAGFIVLAF
jgi:hypothetical protein